MMPHKDKEERRAYSRGYNQRYCLENGERLIEQGRKYRQQPEVKERKRDYNQRYYQEHKEKITAQVKVYYGNNKELMLTHDKKYYGENKDRIIRRAVEYNRMRRETNLNCRVLHALRRRLSNAITRGLKSAKTLELLGCSVDFLRKYLGNKFKEGMSWDNYGLYGWHIDHIIPCSDFDLTKSEEQRKCFHFSNLQPLWAKENLIKGSH